MKVTFPVLIMQQLFELADKTNISPAKITVQAVSEYIDNHKENTTSDSKSDNDRN
jgi:predicted transcriptional regulator